MSLPTIKFSHKYAKLASDGDFIDFAKLLQVIPFQFENLTQELIRYDASSLYKLPPSGPCLILLFLKPGKEVNFFTTIRPDKPEKREYYERMVGQVFNIQIDKRLTTKP